MLARTLVGRFFEAFVKRVILRQALSKATHIDAYASLVEALGFSSIEHPIDYLSDTSSEMTKRLKSLAYSLSRVGGFESERTRAGLWVAVLPQWVDRNAHRERARRRLAKTLVELAPARDRNLLLILTAEAVEDIEIVLPRRRSNGSLGTVRALVSRSNPTRHHLELLESLILIPGDTRANITRRWSDAFNVEKITKGFYLEFRALRDRLVEVLIRENPENPLLAIRDNAAALSDLRRYVTRNLGRVLFLWFIQSKGWLDNDSHYLLNLYNSRCRTGRDYNFFRDALIPLFFEALAKKPEHRSETLRLLGNLPYLNGGLFNQTGFEDKLYGEEREHVDVIIPNAVFDPRMHASNAPTVLGLLSSYRFTTRESTPDDQSLDPDPELLGKVFENLNEDRKKTGTYYTPREVVRFMCREALDGYLRHVTGIKEETLEALRLEALDPAATDIRLSPEERVRLEKALLEVKVCDPAVGSGAFPVGMLQEIIQLLIGIEQSADVSISVGGQRVAEWKEGVITNCLYGVDINPEAVDICHLRLWLSMVIDADRPVPLPNLDFRFEAGDSLVDRIADLPLLNSLPSQIQMTIAVGGVPEAIHEMEKTRAKYALTDDPGEARRLRAAVKEAQLNAVRVQIDELIDQCSAAAKERATSLKRILQLGPEEACTRKTQNKIAVLGKTIDILKQFHAHLTPDAPYKKPFLWPVEFPEVFENGGFDIVVANPPYVRQEKLEPEDQQAYAATYPEVYKGTADLLVFFFARAVHILKKNGRLAFITSNKFHRAGYGEGLRNYLPRELSVEHVVDFGDLEVFDAIAYPSILVASKKAPRAETTTRVARLAHVIRRDLAEMGMPENPATVRERLENLDDLLERDGIADFPQVLLRRDGWVLEDPKHVRLFDRLMEMGTPLGEFVKGRMYYGIKTGLNEAFVIDGAKRAELISADPKSADLIKPWLRGKDIKRWRPEWAGLYVIAIQSSADVANKNVWQHAKTEREARTAFKAAYPALHDYVSRFEDRLRPRADQGRWWWELRSCTYYAEFEQPKLIWATITPEPRFLWDDSGFYTNQKCYIAPGLPKWATAIMNSQLMFVLAAGTRLSEKQGGFYEWEKKYMAVLPIVTPDSRLKNELSAAVDLSSREPGIHDAQVDNLVASLYGVTAAEQRLIDQWVKARRETGNNEELKDD